MARFTKEYSKELEQNKFLTRDMSFYNVFEMPTSFVDGDLPESLLQKSFLRSFELRKKLIRKIDFFNIDEIKKSFHTNIVPNKKFPLSEEELEYFDSCIIKGIGCISDEEAYSFIINYKNTFEDKYRLIILSHTNTFFYEDDQWIKREQLGKYTLIHTLHSSFPLDFESDVNQSHYTNFPFIQLDLTQSDDELLLTINKIKKYINEETNIEYQLNHIHILNKIIRKKGITKGMKYANLLFICDCLELGLSELYITEQIDSYFYEKEIDFTLKIDTYQGYKKEINILLNS